MVVGTRPARSLIPGRPQLVCSPSALWIGIPAIVVSLSEEDLRIPMFYALERHRSRGPTALSGSGRAYKYTQTTSL